MSVVSDASLLPEHQQKILRIERAVLLATVALLPLLYVPGIEDPFNMPKLTLLLCSVSIATGMRISTGKTSRPYSISLWFPLLAVAAAFLVSWLLSPHRDFALLGFYGRYHGLLPYLGVIIFGGLLADAFKGHFSPVLKALVGGGAAVALIAIVQMLFFGEYIASQSQTGYVTSSLGHSNFVGGFLAIVLPLSIHLWMDRDMSRWGMAATILIASGIMFSGSQGAWVAAAGGVTWLVGSRPSRPITRILVKGGALAFTLGASAGVVLISMMLEHPLTRLPGFMATATSRGFLWETAWKVGMERFLVGWGPGAFAVEGPLHRHLQDALLFGYIQGDDPHSLPLAMFANTGFIGVAAFVAVVSLALMRAKKNRAEPGPALVAGLIAYVVQSLVSVDVITIRFVGWILIATLLVRGIASQRGTTAKQPRRGALIPAVILTLCAISAVAAASTLLVPDRLMDRAVFAVSDGRIAEGRTDYEAAIAIRSDTEYRRRYAAAIGQHALTVGGPAAALIQEMKREFGYLDHHPDPQALALKGQLLNGWSSFRPEANADALDAFSGALSLDPNNPALAVDKAEVLLQLGEFGRAEEELLRFDRLLRLEYPEYAARHNDVWSTLAIAQILGGDKRQALQTLDHARPEGCNHAVAKELLAQDPTEENLSVALLCPAPMERLVPQRRNADRPT